MKKITKESPLIVLSMGTLILILFIGVLFTINGKSYEVNLNNNVKEIKENWTLTNRDTNNRESFDFPLIFNNLKKKSFSISRVLDDNFDNINVDSFIFITNYARINVYLNEELIYQNGYDIDKELGKTLGRTYNIVKLPEDFYNKELRIDLDFLVDNIKYTFEAPVFGTDVSFFSYLTEGEAFHLLISFWILLMGIFIILIYIILLLKTKDIRISNLFFVGLFSVSIGIYLLCRTSSIRYFISNTYVLHMLEFLSLGLIPIPIAMMIGIKCNDKFKNLLFNFTYFLFLNVFVQIVLNNLKIYDYRECVFMTHILIIIGAIICSKVLIEGYRNNEKSKLFIFSFMCILVGGVVEILIFYYPMIFNIGSILKGCVFIFVLTQIYIFAIYYFDVYKKSILSSVYKKMAYTDSLTELLNRAAFEEKIDLYNTKLKSYEYIWCISIDINDLKYINDNFGHFKGDKFIVDCSKTIQQCFEYIGNVYRVGGDEFIIFADNISEETIKKYINNLYLLLDKCNKVSLFNISVSLGYDKFNFNQDNDMYDLVARVDRLMYDDKRRIKSKYQDQYQMQYQIQK